MVLVTRKVILMNLIVDAQEYFLSETAAMMLCFLMVHCVLLIQPSTFLPKVFISYCWCNSHDAVTKGTKEQAGSLGWNDPRKLKEFLAENGINSWMDIERVQAVGI